MPNTRTLASDIELTDVERAELTAISRSRSLPAALTLRARSVLACEGPDKFSTEVASSLSIDRGTVNKWRGRYARDRISGLYDELRPGATTYGGRRAGGAVDQQDAAHQTGGWLNALEYSGSSRLDTTLAEARREAEGTNVHLLDGDEVLIEGVRFLGATLWTDFELAIETPEGRVSDAARAMKMATNLLNDYTLIRAPDESAEPDTWRHKQGRKLQAADTLRIHQVQRAWLCERLAEPFAGPTVVVTHHAPHRGSLAIRYADDWASGACVNELPDAFFDVPVLWIHGHTHQPWDYQVRSCRVVCNPRGYVNWSGRIENKDFNPGLIVEVKSG